MNNLKGKVALITGGNSGIGMGMASGIVKAGGNVCLWGRRKENNDKAVDKLKALGANGKIEALQCDVSDEQNVNDSFAHTLEKFGRVDGCFANAGMGDAFTPFHKLTFDAWRKMMSINLDGVFLTLRAAANHMIERAKNGDAYGRLVITSSLASRMGAAGGAHYGATKSAVNGMSKALAVELAQYGITTNTILPGWIESEMTDKLKFEKFEKNVISRVPLKRWGKAEEFEGIAAYLMSEASNFHNGDEIMIDGGYVNF